VIAVGPGKMDEKGARVAMEVKAGDKVLINKYGGDEFKIEDNEYKVMGQDDVLAIIEK
jgi:chaperonin GroES